VKASLLKTALHDRASSGSNFCPRISSAAADPLECVVYPQSTVLHEEAITEEKKAFEMTGGPIREDGTRRINDILALIYAKVGRKTEALTILAEMDEPEKEGRYTYLFVRAGVFAELGDREQAFKWLEKAYAVLSPGMVDMKGLLFDKIHDDPRFADLVRRVGLPQ